MKTNELSYFHDEFLKIKEIVEESVHRIIG